LGVSVWYLANRHRIRLAGRRFIHASHLLQHPNLQFFVLHYVAVIVTNDKHCYAVPIHHPTVFLIR
jgi:hypothetical protein